MFISKSKFKTKSGKIYQSTLLRESYRENGRVKKRTIANLSRCSAQEIKAIELALAHKHDLSGLGTLSDSVLIKEGRSIGGVWAIYQVAKELGIAAALGDSHEGKLALWQVFSRLLEQGSRLSTVRLGETYAIASTLTLKKGFRACSRIKLILNSRTCSKDHARQSIKKIKKNTHFCFLMHAHAKLRSS